MNKFAIIHNSTEFELYEKQMMIQLLKQCDINEKNIKHISFFWCSAFNSKNGIIGAYIPERENSIYLMQREFYLKSYDALKSHMIQLLPTVIHELTHRTQYQRNKILYRLQCIPGVRQFTIEIEARKNEHKIEKMIQEDQIKWRTMNATK